MPAAGRDVAGRDLLISESAGGRKQMPEKGVTAMPGRRERSCGERLAHQCVMHEISADSAAYGSEQHTAVDSAAMSNLPCNTFTCTLMSTYCNTGSWRSGESIREGMMPCWSEGYAGLLVSAAHTGVLACGEHAQRHE